MIGSTFFNSLGWPLTWDMGTSFGILLSSKWVYLGSSNLGSSYRCCQVLRHRMKMWSLAGAPGVGMHGLIFFWSEWGALCRMTTTRRRRDWIWRRIDTDVDIVFLHWWIDEISIPLGVGHLPYRAKFGVVPHGAGAKIQNSAFPRSCVPRPTEYTLQVSSTSAHRS